MARTAPELEHSDLLNTNEHESKRKSLTADFSDGRRCSPRNLQPGTRNAEPRTRNDWPTKQTKYTKGEVNREAARRIAKGSADAETRNPEPGTRNKELNFIDHETHEYTKMKCIAYCCSQSGLPAFRLGLDRPDVTFKVFPIPRGQDSRIDGNTDDWAMVPTTTPSASTSWSMTKRAHGA